MGDEMKMPKIMPGPWKKIGPSITGGHYAITAVAGKFVAEVVYQRDFHVYNTAEINATAIAALPDILEAAIDALSGWRYIRETHGDLYGVGWDRVDEKLKAALLKAGCTDA